MALLVKGQCRLNTRKYLFSQRTIHERNKLSTDCVTASSVDMFKNKLTHISVGQITQIKNVGLLISQRQRPNIVLASVFLIVGASWRMHFVSCIT